MIFLEYDSDNPDRIIKILPQQSTEQAKQITEYWKNAVGQEIIKELSREGKPMNLSELAKKANYSYSIVHDVTTRMKSDGYVSIKEIYDKKKQKIITTNVYARESGDDILTGFYWVMKNVTSRFTGKYGEAKKQIYAQLYKGPKTRDDLLADLAETDIPMPLVEYILGFEDGEIKSELRYSLNKDGMKWYDKIKKK